MLGHVSLRCPRCHGRLKYEQLGSETIYARCGTNCTDDHADRLCELEELTTSLYTQTFEQVQGDSLDIANDRVASDLNLDAEK